MNRYIHTLICSGLLAVLPGSLLAQEVCEDVVEPLSGQRLLRRLSLDLRDKIPSRSEAEAMAAQTTVAGTTLENFLSSEDFVGVMRDYHEELLWPNIDQIPLVPETHMLYPLEITPGDPIYISPVRSVFLRAVGNGNIFVPCKNEPAEYDAQGNLVFEAVVVGTATISWVEGYVQVEPYWAPGTTVKVCALDALDNVAATVCPGPAERYPFLEGICQNFDGYGELVQGELRGQQVACDSELAILSPDCGCGPNLRHCVTPDTDKAIHDSLLEQMMRVVDRVVRENRPYSEVLSDPLVEYNGPITHYLQYMSRLSFDIYGGADDTAVPPALTYDRTNTWVGVRRSGRHAGVLTTPGYLLKHQSNKARAHRFYDAFECSSFIPDGPLPSPFDECSKHEDLTKRCGCNACHKILEPLAAHWGRFSEYGYRHLDESSYPTRAGPECTPPVESFSQLIKCFRFYELDPVGEEADYVGYLNSYVFRTPDEIDNIEQGPKKLVRDSVQSGRFAACTVRRMWTHFMRRAPTLDESAEVLPDLSAVFDSSDYDVKALIKTIVSHPAYRRNP